jgi:hypothetical protein
MTSDALVTSAGTGTLLASRIEGPSVTGQYLRRSTRLRGTASAQRPVAKSEAIASCHAHHPRPGVSCGVSADRFRLKDKPYV